FMRRVLAKLASTRGIAKVGMVDWLPFTHEEYRAGFEAEGRPRRPPGEWPQANLRSVSPEYFRTLGIPLRRGRAFSERDTLAGKPVVVINQTMALQHFAGQDPVG